MRDSGAGFADFNYTQGKWLCLAIYQTFDASEVHYHTIPALSVTPYCLIFAFLRPFIACIEHKMSCYHHKAGFYCRQNSKKKKGFLNISMQKMIVFLIVILFNHLSQSFSKGMTCFCMYYSRFCRKTEAIIHLLTQKDTCVHVLMYMHAHTHTRISFRT